MQLELYCVNQAHNSPTLSYQSINKMFGTKVIMYSITAIIYRHNYRKFALSRFAFSAFAHSLQLTEIHLERVCALAV